MKSNIEQQSKRAVLYCRVSTKEQVDEGNSLVTQEKLCKDYALKNGYSVESIFIEQGESAKTANRTELQKLLLYCSIKKNKIGAIIIYKIDRLSRNTDDYSQLRLLLKKYNVEIKSVSEHFENTPAGRFMENMIANVAQFDNDVRTERTINGLKEALQEGRYIFKAPIGYSNVRENGKATIAQNDQAPLVLETFEEVAKGLRNIDEIRRIFTAKGLSKVKGKPFAKSYFYRFLKNEIYIGRMHQFNDVFKGSFKPIISEDLFNTVQWVLQKKKRSNTRYKLDNEDFPLRRFMFHPKGGKLTGAWAHGRSKKYAHYRFHSPELTISKEKVEKLFEEFISNFTLDSHELKHLIKRLKSTLEKRGVNNLHRIETLTKQKSEFQQKQTELIDKNLKGIIEDSLLKNQLEMIGEKIYEINSTIEKMKDEKSYSITNLLEDTEAYIQSPYLTWENADLEEKLQLQWFYFPEGIVFDGVNCQTTKISSIFKLKEIFFGENSSTVPFRFKFTNHKLKKSNEINLDTQAIDELHTDLIKLKRISQGSPPEEKGEESPVIFKKHTRK